MRVVGFDPSLRNWGIAAGNIDLNTGLLDDVVLEVISTEKTAHKTVRVNSSDLERGTLLATAAIAAAKSADVVFVEVPVGSQSARSMASYGVCIGILSAIRALGIPLIEVSPTEVKLAFTGRKTATKAQMIQTGISFHPDANWPMHNGKISDSKAEHAADAIASIYAGVKTPMFVSILNIHKGQTS